MVSNFVDFKSRWFAVLAEVTICLQDTLSGKTKPSMPENFEIPSGAMGPGDKDVLAQLNVAHPLQVSEAKVRSRRQQKKLWNNIFSSW